MRSRSARWLSTLGIVSASASATAAPAETRRLSTHEVERWLEQPSGAPAEPVDPGARELDVPPPPPRHHGVTVESGVAALGHLGPLKHVSPVAPSFWLKLGFEPLSFLLVFGEASLSIANTGYAQPPPAPRTYRLYDFGAGARLTLPFAEVFGAFVEGSAGLSRVSEDVLAVYGYRQAHDYNLYFGGRLGLEWYPANPHLALGLGGGLRSYGAGLGRERSNEPALAWSAGPAIAYRF